MSDKSPKKQFGVHFTAEFARCDSEKISSLQFVERTLLRAARECGATVVGHLFKLLEPQGVSGVVLIAESHITIHTWPEDNYAAVDIFTCGKKMQPKIALSILKKEFGAEKVITKSFKRGY